jgi:glycine oxidase
VSQDEIRQVEPARRRRETAIPTDADRAAPATTHPLRIAVAGGGVIGLALGWRLAAAGCSVDIYDRAEGGQGASHAAAGMLAAGVEAEPGEQALLPLCLEGRRRWPDFAAELEAASGVALALRSEGTLVVALNRDDQARLQTSFRFQTGLGLELHWLTGAEARAREPWLTPRTAAAVFSPHDHQIDNRAVVRALRLAAAAAGARLWDGFPVEEIVSSAGRVSGVRVQGTVRPADRVVLAAGAWSRQIAGLPEGMQPPVRPVKGQMLALQMDPAAPLLRHVLWAPKCYLVPRLDGRLIVGATTEEKGWDDRLTAGGVLALLEAAWRAVPGVEELPIQEMWVGHRPGSRDDAPILGPVSGLDGLVLATGHHRNGILLTPPTADLLADFILTGTLDPLLTPFGLERFQRVDRSGRVVG